MDLTIDRGNWGPGDKIVCEAENDVTSEDVVRERERRLPREHVVHVDVAMGGFMGIGAPGGVGGTLGEIKSTKTPLAAGYAAYVAADARLLRPIWLHASAHGFESSKFNAGSLMGDLMIGYDVWTKYGNSFSERPIKHSYPRRYAYDCVLGHADFALVGGTKQVWARGDARVPMFTALSAGFQLRAMRALWDTTFGMDVTLVALYDPALRTWGAQFTETVHAGSFVIPASAGGLYKRGGWAMFGLGTTFGM